MLVLHANWTGGSLRLWGESLNSYREFRRSMAAIPKPHPNGSAISAHQFVATVDQVAMAIGPLSNLLSSTSDSSFSIRLPRTAHGPCPSDRLSRAALDGELSENGDTPEANVDPWLGDFTVPAIQIAPAQVLEFLLRLNEIRSRASVDWGHAVRYWMAVADFVLELLADQRFVPTVLQSRDHRLAGRWQPWLHDEAAGRRVAALLRAMPPIVRAAVDEYQSNPWFILSGAINAWADATVRRALIRESFIDAIEDRPLDDVNVAWLSGILGESAEVTLPHDSAHDLLRDVGLWISRLDDVGKNQPLHLCLRLNEPVQGGNAGEALSSDPQWALSLHLQASDDPNRLIDAEDIWRPSSGRRSAMSEGDPQEILLAELGRASRMYPKIESALAASAPTGIQLNTGEAYEFLRDVRPVLEEAGINVIVPQWWDQPSGRLTARLRVDPVDSSGAGAGTSGVVSRLGLGSLVKYQWRIAIGDQPLTTEEFHSLTNQSRPLVNLRGKWIEMSPQQLREARTFLEESASGEMTLLEAIQTSQGAGGRPVGIPVFGMDATGWIADVLAASTDDRRMPNFEQPGRFIGDLRAYQKAGLSWLAFLDSFGLGACLADDMGLGKTIQLIALLLHERQELSAEGEGNKPHATEVGPTLLVAPTSVMSNWMRELNRFAPTLSAHLHHGPDRPVGDRFVEVAESKDLVITTYPLVSRDQESLQRVKWHRVVLDEAQYIKNPPTKQTTAIRALKTPRRVALTGTPVENRLSELWSIMEFCNPGYLGPAAEFRRRFALPIERHRDMRRVDQLREMVRPFILRRVKTDPNVITDLPPCVETKEYATLMPEQAAAYQRVVNSMLVEVDRAQGMQRRGLVLAALVKLKQICNHPHVASGLPDEGGAPQPTSLVDASKSNASLSARSGKSKRLMAMLEEVLATGEKALIFTQFRQMGHMLTAMIQSDLDREALFLHGGTPAAKRQHLIDQFQDPQGGAPVFVLSLKAGGLGLNLTAANHVFHYDRWWNPAVETQATDRAFRIGQTRTVHVHKFVCVGTLEERIDQMIEQKTELAQNIIGAGEQWLTELTSGQLRDLLVLRPTALETDS